MKHKIIKIIITIMIMFSLIPSTIHATDRIVKVGYYPIENYHSLVGGEVKGLEADYLDTLCEITDWQIQYVELSSWSDGINKLRNNEIDILSPANATTGRSEGFLVSDLPIGRTSGAVMTNSDSSIIYKDYQTLATLTYGVERGVAFHDAFIQYMQSLGMQPNIVEYNSNQELKDALNNHQIDAMVANLMYLGDYKLIDKFDELSYYFMVNQNNSELLSELNNAMYEVNEIDNATTLKLQERYLPHINQEPLTKEEVDYVNTLGTINVGCTAFPDPLLYKENGQLQGITIDILNEISKNTGLQFNYVEIPAGDITYDDLRNLDIDLISSVEYNTTNAKSSGIKLSVPYLEAEKLFVSIQGESFDINDTKKVGVSSGSQTIESVIQESYPNFTIVQYSDVEECFKHLQAGDVDLVLQNEYSLKQILNKPQYDDLTIVAMAGIGDSQCLSPMIYKDGVNQANELLADSKFMSVLNKGIRNIDFDTKEMMIIDKTMERYYRYTLFDWIYLYRYALAIMAILFACAVIMVLIIMKMRKQNILLLQKNEKRLMKEKEELQELSNLDIFTGLLNKASFEEKYEQLFQQLDNEDCAFIFMDIDDFKDINDNYGHVYGDRIIVSVANKVKTIFGANSYISRFGGDEFCLILWDIKKEELEKMFKDFRESLNYIDSTVNVTVSIGAICFNSSSDYKLVDLMEEADQALYDIKSKKKNDYEIITK